MLLSFINFFTKVMNTYTKTFLALCTLVLAGNEVLAKNDHLSSPPPGTTIQRGNVITYINAVGEEVFLTYKSGKIKKKDIKVRNPEARSKRFRGTRRRSVQNELLLSSAPKNVSQDNSKKIRRAKKVSFRGRKTQQDAISIAYKYRKQKEDKQIKLANHRITQARTKSRILDTVPVNFTALKEAQKNTAAQRIAREMKRNKDKYDKSRIREEVQQDFAALKEAQKNTKSKKLAQQVDKQIARFLKDLDE